MGLRNGKRTSGSRIGISVRSRDRDGCERETNHKCRAASARGLSHRAGRKQWDLDQLVGYLQTWSSTQRFIAAKGDNPLEQIIDELRSAWGTPEQARKLIWPLILRIGVKTMSEPPNSDQSKHRTLPLS